MLSGVRTAKVSIRSETRSNYNVLISSQAATSARQPGGVQTQMKRKDRAPANTVNTVSIQDQNDR